MKLNILIPVIGIELLVASVGGRPGHRLWGSVRMVKIPIYEGDSEIFIAMNQDTQGQSGLYVVKNRSNITEIDFVASEVVSSELKPKLVGLLPQLPVHSQDGFVPPQSVLSPHRGPDGEYVHKKISKFSTSPRPAKASDEPDDSATLIPKEYKDTTKKESHKLKSEANNDIEQTEKEEGSHEITEERTYETPETSTVTPVSDATTTESVSKESPKREINDAKKDLQDVSKGGDLIGINYIWMSCLSMLIVYVFA